MILAPWPLPAPTALLHTRPRQLLQSHAIGVILVLLAVIPIVTAFAVQSGFLKKVVSPNLES